MIAGWGINSAMIILAAATFFNRNVVVTELSQAQDMMIPLLGNGAAVIFAIALLFSGISSTTTAGIAGGSIFAGLFGEPYDLKDNHTKFGVAMILILGTLGIFVISDPFKGLIYSQMLLSIQLPITVVLQVYLTSSEKVMGSYKNPMSTRIVLIAIAVILTFLNLMLFSSLI
jgi:manganese transport protein